jgi:hypothetical protein
VDFEQQVLVQRENGIEPRQESLHRKRDIIVEFELCGEKCLVQSAEQTADGILKADRPCVSGTGANWLLETLERVLEWAAPQRAGDRLIVVKFA